VATGLLLLVGRNIDDTYTPDMNSTIGVVLVARSTGAQRPPDRGKIVW